MPQTTCDVLLKLELVCFYQMQSLILTLAESSMRFGVTMLYAALTRLLREKMRILL